jgi:hypothetical protein
LLHAFSAANERTFHSHSGWPRGCLGGGRFGDWTACGPPGQGVDK